MLPAQSFSISQNLIEPLGDDLSAVLLTFLDQIFELFDLGLELGDLFTMPFLAKIELLFEILGQLGLDLGSFRVRLHPAKFSRQLLSPAGQQFVGILCYRIREYLTVIGLKSRAIWGWEVIR